MYLNLTEKIMIEKMKSLDGWNRCLANNNQRNICIGNIKNCNGEIIQNYNIETEFNNFTRKYNIENFNIKNVNDAYEFSYILSINEKDYNLLKEKL